MFDNDGLTPKGFLLLILFWLIGIFTRALIEVLRGF